MNATETAELLDRAVALSVWPRPPDNAHLMDAIKSWSEVLADVPAGHARAFVDSHTEGFIKPAAIAERWAEIQAAERSRRSRGERECPWIRACNCSHAPGVCHSGWRDTPADRDGAAARWCSSCWEARNRIRLERGDEPLAVGDTVPPSQSTTGGRRGRR